jgi:hypothetical protein
MNHHETDNLTPAMKQTILALLRSTLWGRERFPFQPPRDTDWQAVYSELQHQTVQHLCVDLLAAADPANTFVYIQNLSDNIRKWHRLMEYQQDLIEMLSREGIPCVVLKGAAVTRYYPQPEYRCMGDIDLIVRPEDFHRALALLQPSWKISGENYRHIDFRRNGIALELHRQFSTFRSPELCRYLEDSIFEGINQAQTFSLGRFTFSGLPRKINGLILLTHINAHMELGLGLRQMIDWMMYVDQELDDEFWQTEFSAAARRLGLEKLAVTVTRMCQLYLGLRQDITWCRHADEELCAELLDHTFRQGNFGRKTPKRQNTAISVLSAAKNIPGFFRALQRYGLRNWPAAEKSRILRPFAWLYQLFRYLRLGLKQEHPIEFLVRAITSEKKQGSLLDRLEVTRMNNDH